MRTWALIYTSRSTQEVTTESLEKLARLAARKNAATNITGLLLFGSGHFLQVLEGKKPHVQMLYKRICLDSRHDNCELLYEHERQARLFPNWNMGALNLDGTGGELADSWEMISSTLARAGAVDWQDSDPVIGWVRQFMYYNGASSFRVA